MPVFELEFEVYCTCGAGLCSSSVAEETRHGGHKVTVSPCTRCGRVDEIDALESRIDKLETELEEKDA